MSAAPSNPGAPQALLTLQGIRKSYAIGPTRVEVLRGVDLSIHKGDMLAVTGPSGCGKSTLMNLIGLLDRPDAGSFYIDGKAVVYADDDTLSDIRNRSIGFVFQQYHLLAKLSALENVTLPLVYRGTPAAEARERAHLCLGWVGMQERGHHLPSELSGGQQQRVAIARALAGQPRLLLADEPTGALDPRVGQDIMELIQRLNREQGITVAIITHDMGIARQCGRQTLMREGRLAE